MRKNQTLQIFRYILILAFFNQCQQIPKTQLAKRWNEERAWAWQKQHGWLVGTNFNPSSAINQLEFWQEDTFDPQTIDRELEWSAELGMNLHRVYLHNVLWEQDSLGFLKRLDTYLDMSYNKGLKRCLCF